VCLQSAAIASPDLPTYNFSENLEGWRVEGSESSSALQWQGDGRVVLLVTEAGSVAIRQWFSDLSADSCRKITVTVKSTDFPTRLTMRWKTDQDTLFSRDKLVAASDELVEGSKTPQTVVFDLSKSPLWRDQITSIEIYFSNLGSHEDSGKVVIEKISFEK
jgi:hypothetical protein